MGRFKHGAARRGPHDRLYLAWRNMRARCNYERDKHYAHYGGRGIRVCQQWESFAAFAQDMGAHPGPGFSLDRTDNDADYSPENCRWATGSEQQRNKTNTRFLTMDGVTLCIADWAKRVGINQNCIRLRLMRGWTTERALSTPPQPKGI